ncbi:hypothetical protein AWJ20_3795 [Sugiyamaella lignohabitans]|uniref:NAD(P)-binding protein n=1 Tax=Sugiyamaella lignohabitans TaxID=796027 RepID=A0A161HF20_9ASCO|nr:uncharacterized protein AWJ20_3795 [Sugiyamaella lignohabitans]ANB11001.1 hypothetical protein AWJ20_3795 [Sugiyamaella lignohabitans]
MSKVYFISGGNRGIGFGFVQELSQRKDVTVIASVRNAAKATELNAWIKEHPNIHTVNYDGNVDGSALEAAKEVESITGGKGIDVFIANAAISDAHYSVLDLPEKNWLEHYKINTLAPLLLFKAFYPLLKKKDTRQVIFISSDAGSIAATPKMSFSAYGQSKAALNYSTKELSFELEEEKFTIIALNPGPVLSDMGTFSREEMKKISVAFSHKHWDTAPSVKESVDELLLVIDKLTPADNGKFFHHDGTIYPW